MVLAWIAMGCVWISDEDHTDRIDADGDGEPVIGYQQGTDCDDHDPEVTGANVYFEDRDGDGYALEGAASVEACSPPSGYTDQLGDCDDGDATVRPGATEICADGVDNDCDGFTCLPPGEYALESFPAIGSQTGWGVEGIELNRGPSYTGAAGDLLASGAGGTTVEFFVFQGPITGDTLPGSAVTRVSLEYGESGVQDFVAHLGDVSGDDVADLLVGCRTCATEDGFSRGGQLYGWFGPREGLLYQEDADLVISGFEHNQGLGSAFGVIPDANDDGLDDLILGVRGGSGTLYNDGAWYFIDGGVSGHLSTAELVAISGNSAWGMGDGPILGADFAGDGGSWAVIPGIDGDGAGGLYLVEEPSVWRRTMEDDCVQVVGNGEASQRFAEAYAVGDFDGDGRDDLAVGAPGGSQVGVVYVFAAPAGEPFTYLGADDARLTIVGDVNGGEFGGAVELGADLDGDGAAELSVRSWTNDEATLVSSFRGFAQGYDEVSGADWRFVYEAEALPSALAGGADLTADGVPDLLVNLYDGGVALVGGGGF